MAERPKPQKKGGLKASREDLQWLRLLDLKASEGPPQFALSRLVALGVVEIRDGSPVITEKGYRLLAG